MTPSSASTAATPSGGSTSQKNSPLEKCLQLPVFGTPKSANKPATPTQSPPTASSTSSKSRAITGARVLTSDQCLAIIKEREMKKRLEMEEKEKRKREREEKKKQKEEEQKKKARKAEEGTEGCREGKKG